MTLNWNDQRGHGDGVTVESTELPNLIGWGETPIEAILDLSEQTTAVLATVADLTQELDRQN
jgi:hypothetical protein